MPQAGGGLRVLPSCEACLLRRQSAQSLSRSALERSGKAAGPPGKETARPGEAKGTLGEAKGTPGEAKSVHDSRLFKNLRQMCSREGEASFVRAPSRDPLVAVDDEAASAGPDMGLS